jgi:hypothetical protein
MNNTCDESNQTKELIMTTTDVTTRVWRSVALAVMAAAIFTGHVQAAEPAAPAAEAKKKPAAVKQKTYATPEEAVQDFVAAMKADDTKALHAILGAGARPLISSGDAVADKEGRARFVKAYDEANKLETSGEEKVVLSIGKDSWPMPIPIVKGAAGWRFDTKQGQEELLNRRIGRNEIFTMQAMLAYVDAQREYYLRNPQKDKLLSYAQRFVSTQGKRDGLYYPTKEGEPQSPLGPLFSGAKAEGYTKGEGGKPVPYHGYYYRILKGQGPDAKGGAYDYVAQGKMIGGFALIAWPATYGNSGVMTFIVNHDGAVYEKDLGPDTATAAQRITKYNPDKTWKRAKEGT